MTSLSEQGLAEPLEELEGAEDPMEGLPQLDPKPRTAISKQICGIEDVPHDEPLLLQLKGNFEVVLGVSDFKGALFLEALVGPDVEPTELDLLVTRKNVPFDIRYIPGLETVGFAGPFTVFRIMTELIDQFRAQLEAEQTEEENQA